MNKVPYPKHIQTFADQISILKQRCLMIAEDENLLKRAAKYLRKLVAEKQAAPSEFTRVEFFARIDEAKTGPTFELRDDETLEDLIKRVG